MATYILFLLLLTIFNCAEIDINKLNKILLEEHNKLRYNHEVSSLQLDSALVASATAYAKSLAQNPNPYFLIPSGSYVEGDNKVGENLYQCNSKSCFSNNITQSLSVWYNEMKYYNFLTPVQQTGTSNFTQIVWKSTKKMGCGAAEREDGSGYKVVCHYLPRGNIGGVYDLNVFQATRNYDEDNNNQNNDDSNNNYNYDQNNDNYKYDEEIIYKCCFMKFLILFLIIII